MTRRIQRFAIGISSLQATRAFSIATSTKLEPIMSLPIFISIEGNIGCGKSTLYAHLQHVLSTNPAIHFIR
jgi:pantothenate kinase